MPTCQIIMVMFAGWLYSLMAKFTSPCGNFSVPISSDNVCAVFRPGPNCYGFQFFHLLSVTSRTMSMTNLTSFASSPRPEGDIFVFVVVAPLRYHPMLSNAEPRSRRNYNRCHHLRALQRLLFHSTLGTFPHLSSEHDDSALHSTVEITLFVRLISLNHDDIG